MTERVIVVGAGGHAKVVLDALVRGGVEVVGLVDDDPATHGRSVLGCTVLGPLDLLTDRSESLVHGIGDNDARAQVADRFPGRWVSMAHPASIVSGSARLHAGACLLAAAVVQADAVVEDGSIVNTGAIVEHDVVVGSFTHVAPRSVLLGGAAVGSRTLVGAGAIVLPGVRVGSRCIVAAGAVVTAHVPDGATVMGVPARRETGP